MSGSHDREEELRQQGREEERRRLAEEGHRDDQLGSNERERSGPRRAERDRQQGSQGTDQQQGSQGTDRGTSWVSVIIGWIAAVGAGTILSGIVGAIVGAILGGGGSATAGGSRVSWGSR